MTIAEEMIKLGIADLIHADDCIVCEGMED